MMGKKILVTGGMGFLGAALVRRLISSDHVVRVLDNGFRSNPEKFADVINEIEMVSADIRDAEAVYQAIRGVDTVIHLAAVNGTEFFYSKPDLVLEVGVKGILNVLDGCIKAGVDDVIVASSSEVYQTPDQIPTDETASLMIPDVTNPRYSYGGSKILTELMALHYGKSHFKRICLFRPHNVYGPDMGYEHVLPQFIVRAAELIELYPSGRVPFPIQGSGEQTRAFIHIDDMVEGMILLLEKGENSQIYHIGNPEEMTIAQLTKKIAAYFGREFSLQEGALQMGSTERRCPDISKIKSLGFSPKISLNEGLPSIIDWYTKHRKKR
ncbi:MAG: NAD-dependent epimerase/dehydratase family protein [Chlamydiales bacterium]|nr:NAD-dependent epimerase/dehydratase family protein [Chlamydiales bacterium]